MCTRSHPCREQGKGMKEQGTERRRVSQKEVKGKGWIRREAGEEGSPQQGRSGGGQRHLFSNLQRPLAQRLRLLVFAPLPIEHSQVIECGRHLGRQTCPHRQRAWNSRAPFCPTPRQMDSATRATGACRERKVLTPQGSETLHGGGLTL